MQHQKIADALRGHLKDTGISQNRAAKKFNVSSATISHIISGHWDSIGPKIWNSLASQLNVSEWRILETANMKTVWALLEDNREEKKMMAIYGPTGTGKTTAAEIYSHKHPSAYYVLGTALKSPRSFVADIQRAMGLHVTGNKEEAVGQISEKLRQEDNPLLIIDDAGKLSERCHEIIMVIYDQTFASAGIVQLGTPHLKERLQGMAAKGKRFFPEYYSRVAYWQPLKNLSKNEVVNFCEAQGITSQALQNYYASLVNNYRDLYFHITMGLKKAAKLNKELDLNIAQTIKIAA